MVLTKTLNDVCEEVEQYAKSLGVHARVFGLEYNGRFTKVCVHMSMPGRVAYKHQYWTDIAPKLFMHQAMITLDAYAKENTTIN